MRSPTPTLQQDSGSGSGPSFFSNIKLQGIFHKKKYKTREQLATAATEATRASLALPSAPTWQGALVSSLSAITLNPTAKATTWPSIAKQMSQCRNHQARG